MATSVARHIRAYLGLGFWLTVLAAAMNGTYWRVAVSPGWQRVLALGTALVAIVALTINARGLRDETVAGGRLGRRITWLLQLTSLGVLVTVGWFLRYGA